MKKLITFLLVCISIVVVYDQIFDVQDEEDLRTAGALVEASRTGDVDRLKFIINNGADVNAKDKHGYAPLHWAATANVVKILANAGAKINSKHSRSSWTPLHSAAHDDIVPVIEALLAVGANIEARSIRGDTPLHRAAGRLNLGAIYGLIQAGADVNSRNKNDETPLHAAARGPINEHKRKRAAIETLLNAGAKVGSRTKSGLLPSDFLLGSDVFESKERSKILRILGVE